MTTHRTFQGPSGFFGHTPHFPGACALLALCSTHIGAALALTPLPSPSLSAPPPPPDPYAISPSHTQLTITLTIAVYSILGDAYPWAQKAALGVCCGTQLLMAAWCLVGDPIDRLAGLISSIVSLLECVATALLLVIETMGDDVLPNNDAEAYAGLSGAATALLMASVFVPIGLTVYDSIVLPVVEMVRGKSAGEAIFSVAAAVLMVLSSAATEPWRSPVASFCKLCQLCTGP